jgi:lipoprotein NlpI
MSRKWLVIFALVAAITPFTIAEDGAWQKAQEAFKKQDYKTAQENARLALKDDPKNTEAYLLLGMSCLNLRQNEPAVAAFTEALKQDDKLAFAYDRRGDAYLKLGKFTEAIKDFDQVLEMNPDFAPQHWRRGIALYYAKRYEDGVKQFETHKKANPEDVENAAWHYLCNVQVIGKEKARAELIDVTQDRRVPMAEIQKLFAGKVKPADVIARAEKVPADTEDGREARFYAHLYVGLFYEAEGDAEKSREHLSKAVKEYKICHYMWDVGQAHIGLLKPKKN